ncbi:MAG: TonB-dependent receptor [Pseudomonadota bacterium]
MPAAEVAAQEVITLDPIVVIGERQERTILDTATSVSVYQQDDIERDVGREINDLITGSPNVHKRSISEIPNIRGIEGGGPGGLANTALGGTLPRIPLIVDEVARPASIPNVDFASTWDVEQVEVLKGPQTTLRGRAAIGGAIVVKTADPTFRPEMAAQMVSEFDEFGKPSFAFNGMASFGIIEDILAVRGTVEKRIGDDPRDIVNVPVGRDGDILNEFDQTRLRGKVLFTPQGEDGPWRFLGLVEYQGGTVPQTRGTVQSTGFSDGITRGFSDRQVDFLTGGLRLFKNDALTGALDASYQFGEVGKLRSITSYSETEFKSRPEQPQNLFFQFEEEVVNEDLIFNFGSDETRVSGLVGGTYTYRKQDARIDNTLAPPGFSFLTVDGKTETLSAFTDLRIGLTSDLDLLLGGRVLYNKDRRTTFSSINPMAPATSLFNQSETVLLPSAGLRYTIDEKQTIAATARRGWNAGSAAVNFFLGLPYTYESETVWTFETAYRLQTPDNRFTFAATAFYNLYDNPQFFLETQPGNRFSLQVVNLPKGETYGAEFEGRAKVTDEFLLFAGLGLLETEITRSTAANPQLKGNRFGKDPDVTGNIGFVWTPEAAPDFSLDGKASYIGSSFNDFNNFRAEKIGDYALVDLGATYTYHALELRAFIKNLFDVTGRTQRVGGFAAVTPPRTAGVSATARF